REVIAADLHADTFGAHAVDGIRQVDERPALSCLQECERRRARDLRPVDRALIVRHVDAERVRRGASSCCTHQRGDREHSNERPPTPPHARERREGGVRKTKSPPGEPPYKPLDAKVIPRFAGIRTFMRAPHVTDLTGVDAVVHGIPFDTATSYR